MNNEEKILSLLSNINDRLDRLEAGQAKLEAGQAKLEASLAKLEASQAKLEASQAKLEASLAKLEAGQAKLEEKIVELDEKVDVIFDQTAHLTEFKTEIIQMVDDVRMVTRQNTYDIARLKAAQ